MSDGYPTKECIKYIRSWRISAKPSMPLTIENVERLLDVIEENCRWPEFSMDYGLGVDTCDGDVVVKFYYSTGGWSGHEEIIDELEKTWFWMFCWEQSRRGGHYIFEINPKSLAVKSPSTKDRNND